MAILGSWKTLSLSSSFSVSTVTEPGDAACADVDKDTPGDQKWKVSSSKLTNYHVRSQQTWRHIRTRCTFWKDRIDNTNDLRRFWSFRVPGTSETWITWTNGLTHDWVYLYLTSIIHTRDGDGICYRCRVFLGRNCLSRHNCHPSFLPSELRYDARWFLWFLHRIHWRVASSDFVAGTHSSWLDNLGAITCGRMQIVPMPNDLRKWITCRVEKCGKANCLHPKQTWTRC